MTCANLWLGRWAPPAAGSLKEEVRRELLALPAELLFCDRALPLSDPQLRQAAAKAMLDHCDMAFAGLLVADEQGNVRSAALAAWLRVLRKALALCPTHDTGAPLRALMALQPKLLELARELPSEAIEVVQQVARWRQEGCDAELAALLGSLLECLFSSVLDEESQVLLPLLADLASNYWPRATLGDFALDHQAIAVQALTTLQAAVGKEIESGDPDADDPDVEAAFAVWETFVVTLRDGTRASLQGPLGSANRGPWWQGQYVYRCFPHEDPGLGGTRFETDLTRGAIPQHRGSPPGYFALTLRAEDSLCGDGPRAGWAASLGQGRFACTRRRVPSEFSQSAPARLQRVACSSQGLGMP